MINMFKELPLTVRLAIVFLSSIYTVMMFIIPGPLFVFTIVLLGILSFIRVIAYLTE